MVDFNDDEVYEFIGKWYRSRLENEAEATRRAQDLSEALRLKPSIKELAHNPLLLTIIGVIHRYEAQLPEDRLTLYDKATEALLYTWDNVRQIIDQKFTLGRKRQFLEKVGFALQSQEQGAEGGTLMHRSRLYELLRPDFMTIFNCDAVEAEEYTQEFVEKIRQRSGLLVELAPDQFGFVHKTFQEYFAAKYIANETIRKFDLGIMKRYIDQFLHHPFWQETLLLALRALPAEQTKLLLEYILSLNSFGAEDLLFHDHYFVVKFLAEQGSWISDPAFVEEQIITFLQWSLDNRYRYRSHPWKEITWRRVRNWLAVITDSLVRKFTTLWLLNLAEDHKQDGDLRGPCAEAIGRLGVKDKAVEILLTLAEDLKQADGLRWDCAYSVGQLGVKDHTFVDRLLTLLEDSQQNSELRHVCALAVSELGAKDNDIAERLLTLAEDSHHAGHVRSYCAYAVGKLGIKDHAIVGRLLTIAGDSRQEAELRRGCAFAVGLLGVIDKALEILLTLAHDIQHYNFWLPNCAHAVGVLGFKDKAVEILLTFAEDTKQDASARSGSVYEVGWLGVNDQILKDQAIIERLLTLVEDSKQDGSVRRVCADVVGRLGVKDKAIINRLLIFIEDPKQDASLRGDCAAAIGRLGVKDHVAIERLLLFAENPKQDGDLRRGCAYAVGKLGVKDKAINILVDLYRAKEEATIYENLWDLAAV